MELGRNIKATLEIISPVHIDSGRGDLVVDYDFTVGREIYVIDRDIMWEMVDESIWSREGLDARLSNLLKPNQYATCARYRLNNPVGANIAKIKEQVKTPQGQLYIPGSSLKGAIRTALAFAMVDAGVITVSTRDLGRNPRFAAQYIESSLFGPNPNSDLLRALHISDSEPVDIDGNLRLYSVSIYSLRGDELRSKGNQFHFYVEALPRDATLNFSIRIDEYLLRSKQLKFDRQRDWLVNFVRHCNTFAGALIEAELEFYEFYRMNPLRQFYQSLKQQFDQLNFDRECLLQMSWGTGWGAKTVGVGLTNAVFDEVRSRFRLGRKNEEEFPKSRRLIESGNAPQMPMGWVKLRVENAGK